MSDNAGIPKFNGLYKVRDAARLVSWADGRPGAESLTRKELREWVDSGVGRLRWAEVLGGKKRITFRALISLRFIFRVQRQGHSLDAVTEDAARLKRVWGVDWPFASKPLWYPLDSHTFPPIQDPARTKEAWRLINRRIYYWQGLNRQHGLEFGEDGVACVWRPVKDVKIQPGIVSGAPCVDGTRIPTWVIFGMAEAGESVEEIAYWYELPDARVRNVVDWEGRLAAISV